MITAKRCRGRYGTGHSHFHRSHHQHDEGDVMTHQFGVRRPVRYLTYKLELDESQVKEIARIIDALKTERAQHAVDERRALTNLAEAVSGEVYNPEKAGEAAGIRKESSAKLADAVSAALGEIHALLDDEQRSRLAYLIRTGALVL